MALARAVSAGAPRAARRALGRCWRSRRTTAPTGLLENALLVGGVAVLVATRKALPLSRVSYTLIFVFLCLHTVGAHYTYSLVPYDAWFEALTGRTLSSLTGWERNHFDRLVHFSYGLLLAYPAREVFLRVADVRGFWGYYLPLDVVMATSMLYELIEWGAAAVFGGDLGVAYLGTQGDPWDAQKDMALATLGAIIAMLITAAINWRFQRDFAREWAESLRVKRRRAARRGRAGAPAAGAGLIAPRAPQRSDANAPWAPLIGPDGIEARSAASIATGDQHRRQQPRPRARRHERALALAHVHLHQDAEVVVDRDHAVQHADDGEPDVAGVDRGAEEVELADEAGERRDAGERQHEDGHREAEHRAAEAEARRSRRASRSARRGGRARSARRTRPSVMKRVGDAGRRAAPRRPPASPATSADQQVAGVRDARVGEHALDARLRAAPSTLPTVMVSAASTQSERRPDRRAAGASAAQEDAREAPRTPAAFTPTAMNAVTGVGAPS